MFFSAVTWASDTKYRYLSKFLSWVHTSMFFPVTAVGVRAAVNWHSPVLTFKQCPECQDIFRRSRITDLVKSVSWKDITGFDLGTLVS